ncbi:MAG TPA: carbon-nitrogen family hydrolase [Actinomycetes bacterium]|nr:carbon-nitrogen family hydrolase [Actinomycetes bacterium]
MRVAAVQYAFDENEPWDQCVDRMLTLVAAQSGADLVVLPELWPNGGFTYERWRETAQPLDGSLIQQLQDAASALGSVLHAGSFVELHPDGALTNTSVVLDASGVLTALYRKIHLFGFGEGEPTLMTAGREIVVAKTAVGALGLTTCYDLRFPELYRQLVDAGAELVVVPAAWPHSRIDHWSVLARARAIENQMFVVAVNTAGTHGGKRMGGHSVVIDPRGQVLAEAGESQEVLTVDIDLDQVSQWRRDFPVLPDRRL